MVDVVPVLLLIFGLISALKPAWVVAISRRQKAAGTNKNPRDIEMTDTHYGVTRIAGIAFLVFGLIFTLQSL